MRETIYTLMETEMDEAVIDCPSDWSTWGQSQRSEWAVTAKETMANDLAILNGWYLLDDLREDKG